MGQDTHKATVKTENIVTQTVNVHQNAQKIQETEQRMTVMVDHKEIVGSVNSVIPVEFAPVCAQRTKLMEFQEMEWAIVKATALWKRFVIQIAHAQICALEYKPMEIPATEMEKQEEIVISERCAWKMGCAEVMLLVLFNFTPES